MQTVNPSTQGNVVLKVMEVVRSLVLTQCQSQSPEHCADGYSFVFSPSTESVSILCEVCKVGRDQKRDEDKSCDLWPQAGSWRVRDTLITVGGRDFSLIIPIQIYRKYKLLTVWNGRVKATMLSPQKSQITYSSEHNTLHSVFPIAV